VSKNKLTNISLFVIVVLLGLILFKGKIQSYFKAREVLNRASIYNIAKVAAACWDVISDDNNSLSIHCTQTLAGYQSQVTKWNGLIKEYRDINCNDFENKAEANDFYQYISGELAGGYYHLMVQNEELLAGKELNPLTMGKIMENKAYDGHCHYDPYGLDTNGDCNACENYAP
jgi:hypothetical protein